jgi:RNA methyltransferase, TrmH family
VVTSPANPRLKGLVALRRRRHRDQTGQTLVEGYEEIWLAVEAGARPTALYFCPALAAPGGDDLLDRAAAAGAELVELGRAAFEKVAYRESPDGWLAVVPAVATDLARLRLPADPLVLVCEAVEKPGNLGAILRTADAAGAAAVLAADPVTDWGNPNLVRASKGTVFAVPVAAADGPRLVAWLRERGIAVVAATPHTDLAYTEVDLTGPAAIVVGAEKEGLSAAWLAAADHRVRIPMTGRADSLNVATSAAVLAYEAVRQRDQLRSQLRGPPAT